MFLRPNVNNKRILFLYSEIAGYTIACFNELKKLNVEIFLIRWSVKDEAPFQFNLEGVNESVRDEYSNDDKLINYCNEINPDLLIISGWMDSGYMKVAKVFSNNIPVVLTMDNCWKGSIRQQFSRIMSPFFILNKFSHIWVPGEKQKIFAKKLGFSDDNILTGLYSCDRELYSKYFKKSREIKNKKFPKVFLYVGRYIQSKGLYNLWNAFIELDSQHENEWELWCVGTGDEWKNRICHSKIKHFGFVQPDGFLEIIKQSGVYVLPSEFEPWGVSLHEFVTAGFPVIVSENVGSSELFVKNGVNGFVVKSGSVAEIKKAMMKFIKMNQKELLLMSQESVSLSEIITPRIWVKKLTSLV